MQRVSNLHLKQPYRSTEVRWTLWTTIAGPLLGLAAVWLLLPALFSTHVEAFSARLQTMAIMKLQGSLPLDDTAYPLNIEYFYTTRGGVVHVLEWLMRATHGYGRVNFQILTLASFALLVGASVRFVRRWSDERVSVALAVLILTPGLVEISFYFSDNLPSAAMVALSLAVVGRRSKWSVWLTAGALLGCGVLLRIDAILAVPSLALLAVLQVDSTMTRKLTNWLAGAVGAAVIFVGYWWTTSVSLWQALLIGKLHGSIHNSWGDRMSPYRVLILFFGPTSVLIMMGMYRRWHERSMGWKITMVVWPVAFYILVMSRTVELRDYLLLGAPFVLLHGAAGLSWLPSLLSTGSLRQRRLIQGGIVLYVLSVFAPPMIILHDGPRFVLGRIYSPLMWRRWQRSTDQAIAEVKTLASSQQSGSRVLLLSTLFQSDRYIHLALLEDGFVMRPVVGESTCGGVETYQKGPKTIYHVRTENPYFLLSAAPLSMPAEYVRAYQIHAGLTCIDSAKYDRAYMVSWGRMWQGYMAETKEFQRYDGPVEIPFPRQGTWHVGQYKFLGVQRITSLSAADVSSILRKSDVVMTSFELGNKGDWRKPNSYDVFHLQAVERIWKLPSHP